ncbi:hypothetical protein JHW33_25390 (plasmid) [Rahnella aceris]|uniref:DUF6966 domain-containing protein n=1 Tax=Rahnella sp. (strain Y9602) TaxID=2703885 RepID=UPI001905E31E|nr:hypothetical protein [Rahnella aceris]QQN37663.1 hypothetical protein JHW33_25390 [Rahnella aceris]
MKNKIHKLIFSIIDILRESNEEYWANIFEKYSTELEVDYDECLYNLRRLYGGMGSFNDLILHQSGVPLKEKNNELDLLRKELYSLIK